MLSMARLPNSLSCICFLGDTSDGDTLLSPSWSTRKVNLGAKRRSFPSKENRKVRGEDVSATLYVLVWKVTLCMVAGQPCDSGSITILGRQINGRKQL